MQRCARFPRPPLLLLPLPLLLLLRASFSALDGGAARICAMPVRVQTTHPLSDRLVFQHSSLLLLTITSRVQTGTPPLR
ncbi:hypothetical protein B0H14DRAFT_2817726 [Mycena olivaceomarginata]|nr:hypothetical protein B0H14DRAFT_2817726 [Mycena olivaceomarginata]